MDLRADVELKRNDLPILQRQLLDADKQPVDLTNVDTVVFNMATAETHVAKITRAAAVVVDATDGQVSYTFQAGDTDTSGWYDAEFEVTMNDGTVQSYPVPDYLTVEITDDLG